MKKSSYHLIPQTPGIWKLCAWLVPSLLPLLVGRHETVQRPSLVFPHFFCILFHYFLTAMQEEALKLVLLALEDGSALSRKVLVLFVVQRLEPRFPQASKTSIGHVVQLLYRASCFKVWRRFCSEISSCRRMFLHITKRSLNVKFYLIHVYCVWEDFCFLFFIVLYNYMSLKTVTENISIKSHMCLESFSYICNGSVGWNCNFKL